MKQYTNYTLYSIHKTYRKIEFIKTEKIALYITSSITDKIASLSILLKIMMGLKRRCLNYFIERNKISSPMFRRLSAR